MDYVNKNFIFLPAINMLFKSLELHYFDFLVINYATNKQFMLLFLGNYNYIISNVIKTVVILN